MPPFPALRFVVRTCYIGLLLQYLPIIMGIQDLQTFLENEGVGVDLFRIARNHAGGFRLVLDAEGCLDRLYGGYFSGNPSISFLCLVSYDLS